MHPRSVKPSWRLPESQHQTSWMGEKNKEKYLYSFERYLKSCVKRDYGTEKTDEIAKEFLKNFERKVGSYKKEICGDYPKMLKNYVWKEFGIEI